jgi:hypothetical protein
MKLLEAPSEQRFIVATTSIATTGCSTDEGGAPGAHHPRRDDC